MYVLFMDDVPHRTRDAELAWAELAQASTAVAVSQTWQLSDEQLVAALRAEQVAAAQRDSARLALIRELDQRGYALTAGTTGTAAWLAHELLIDPRVAAADVRAAYQLDPRGDTAPPAGVLTRPAPPGTLALAQTGRALLAGQISTAHAHAVSAVIRALPQQGTPAERRDLHGRAQTWLLDQCATFAPTDVRRLGLHLRHVLDPDDVLADERDASARTSFWVKPDADGITYRFGGTTDSVTGSQLSTFIDTHSAPRPHLDEHTGAPAPDPRTPDQRRGDAFSDLVNLATNADPTTSGAVSTQLIITTTVATLQTQLGERGTPCALTETGQPLSAGTIRKLACDAQLIPILLGAHSEPLDVGRATRTIPTSIRRALIVRDKHCAFPSCTRPARWANAHHITHWADNGPTALNNLVLLCGHHHDLIHHSAWTVTITAGRPVFTPPPPGSPPPRPPPIRVH